MSHNNSLVATRKFSSPGLAVSFANETSLRLHKRTKSYAGGIVVSVCDPLYTKLEPNENLHDCSQGFYLNFL